jgi:hypothetical protein
MTEIQATADAIPLPLPLFWPVAMKLLISLVDRYADSPEGAHRLDDLLAEDRAILARYLPDLAPDHPAKPDEPANGDES